MEERWQKQREEERKGRWLHRIQRKVCVMRSTGRTRKEETIISRLGFVHARLNSRPTLFKIGKHNPGRCEYCNEEETLEHVMLYNCQKYDAERRELILNLKEIKLNYDLRDLLQRRNVILFCFSILGENA